jgi:hypothetical protein
MSEPDDDCIPGTPIIHELSEDLESSVSRIKEIQSSVQDSASYSEGFKSFPDNPPQRTVPLKRCFDSQDEKMDTSVGSYDLFDTFNTESVSKASRNQFSGAVLRRAQESAHVNQKKSNESTRPKEVKMNEKDDPDVICEYYSASSESPGLEGYCPDKVEKVEKKILVDDIRTIISRAIRLLESQIVWLDMRVGQAPDDIESNSVHTLLSFHSEFEKQLYTRRRDIRKQTLLDLQRWLEEYL